MANCGSQQKAAIARGSYGEVLLKNRCTVTKVCDLHNGLTHDRSFELTTISELAVLSKSDLTNIPKMKDVELAQNGKVSIDMEHCGITLLEYAKTMTMPERLATLSKIAFQLVEAALHLQENGIIHNDIKSANVMVTKEGNVKLIDFGLCAFETIHHTDDNLKSKNGTIMTKDWGTYTITPPETFIDREWLVDKYMSWSIGITLCEFLYKTHSFLCDYMLDDVEKAEYKKHYKNDWAIKQLLANIYSERIHSNHTCIIDVYSTYFTAEQSQMLRMMLALKPSNRSTLHEIYECKLFDQFKPLVSGRVPLDLNTNRCGILPSVFGNVINGPKCSYEMLTVFRRKRIQVIEWAFDVFNMCNKLHIFSQAVNLLDRYCSLVQVHTRQMRQVAFACMFVSQHIAKRDALPLKRFMDVLHIATGINTRSVILVDEIYNTIENVIVKTGFDIYFQSFDVIIAKTSVEVDMPTVLRVLSSTIAPYNNAMLIDKYIDAMCTEPAT